MTTAHELIDQLLSEAIEAIEAFKARDVETTVRVTCRARGRWEGEQAAIDCLAALRTLNTKGQP